MKRPEDNLRFYRLVGLLVVVVTLMSGAGAIALQDYGLWIAFALGWAEAMFCGWCVINSTAIHAGTNGRDESHG